jgi:hypothetical protein
MIKYPLLSSISTIECHGSFEIFTNSPNPTKHLMVNSLKKIKEKNLKTKFSNFIGQLFFFTFN